MYKPDGGAWIGLAKVHWEWGGGTNDGQNLILLPRQPPDPSVTNPVGGDDQFPSYTDSASAILTRTSIPGFPGWVQM